MNDVAERRLRAAFRREALPAAPPTLVAALERLPDVIAARPGPRRRPVLRAALGLAAVLALGGTVAVSIGQRGPTPAPSGGPSTAGLSNSRSTRQSASRSRSCWSDLRESPFFSAPCSPGMSVKVISA